MQQPIVDYDANTDLNRNYFYNGDFLPDDGFPLVLDAEAGAGTEAVASTAAEAAAPKKEAETWDTRILGHIVYVGDAVYKIVKSENGYLLMQFQDLTGSAKRRIAGYNNRDVRKGQGRRQFKRNG